MSSPPLDSTPTPEKTKGKRRRREVDSEEIEEAERKLNEAKKERDTAEEKRDSAKEERDKYLKDYEAKIGTKVEQMYHDRWQDAENSLKNAESALKTAQRAFDVRQRVYNKLIDPDSPHSSSSSDSSTPERGKQRLSKRTRVSGAAISDAPESVQRFWKLLKEARIENDGKKLQLIGETHFLGDRSLPSELYVRTHYEKILGRIHSLATEKKLTKSAILGTPGIGKTFFLYWLVWKLRQDKPDSVILFETPDITYRFCGDEIVQESEDVRAFRRDLRSESCWYLVDAMRPYLRCSATTVLATSPDRDKWYQYEQQVKAVVLYMPVFTLEEMQECREACFPDLAVEDVRIRFNKYGGMARAVLDMPATGQQSLMTRYDTAVGEVDDDFDVKVLLNVSSAIRKKDDFVHRIVHMNVTDFEEYLDFEYKLASEEIKKEIVKKFWSNQHDRVRKFVKSCKGNAYLSTIRGDAFEDLAHDILCKGGMFRVRNLETGVVEEEEWPAREIQVFDSVENVKSEKYARPLSGSFPVFDSFAGGTGIQITVRSDHPLKGLKLNELLRQVDLERIVFVVPEDQFGEFKKQNIKDGNADANALDQYVLEIPL